MLNSLSKIFNRRFCFVLGVFFTFLTLPVINFFAELFTDGIPKYEVQSMASYPVSHMARLYTRPGLGEQDLTFEVDGRVVWFRCAMGGDLGEKIIWDKTGEIVSLELAGEKVFSYNTFWRSEIKK